MKLKPHPENPQKAVVTIEGRHDLHFIEHCLQPDLASPSNALKVFSYVIREGLRKGPIFPYDKTVSYRKLGHLAGEVIEQTSTDGHEEEIPLAGQVADFLAERIESVR